MPGSCWQHCRRPANPDGGEQRDAGEQLDGGGKGERCRTIQRNEEFSRTIVARKEKEMSKWYSLMTTRQGETAGRWIGGAEWQQMFEEEAV